MTDKAGKAVFLDRDGVLNRAYLHEDGKTHPPASLEELEILPGVPEICGALRRAGFLLIAVTNQPDVARGTQNREVVEAINEKIREQVPLDDFLVCYHDDHHRCACRKPKPGMILEAARRFHIDLAFSYMIGDSWKDIEAGRHSGCKTILVNAPASEASRCRPNFFASSFSEAYEWILHPADVTASRSIDRETPIAVQGGLHGDRTPK